MNGNAINRAMLGINLIIDCIRTERGLTNGRTDEIDQMLLKVQDATDTILSYIADYKAKR